MTRRMWGWLYPAAFLALAGCRNPLRTYEDEYGRVADAETLRSADVLPLAEHVERTLPESPPDPPRELPPGVYEGAERRDVSIEQARAWTLEHNLDLRVAMFDPEIAGTVLSAEEAAFEAVFRMDTSFSNADPGQAEVFRDQFVRPVDIDPRVEIPLRSGGRARVGVPFSRRETFAGFFDDAEWAFDVDVGLTQPLLRGAGRRANTHPIRLAALGSQIAQARTKLEVIRQVAAADRAYWLLYRADRVLAVRQEQYERALAQLREAEARAAGGVGPEIEVTRAVAGVSRRLESIILAELAVRDAQRTLKRVMNVPALDVDSPVMLELTSAPDPVRYDLREAELLAAAMDNRMELLELELRLAQDVSTIDFAENQRLPLFTLDYIYRFHGAGSSLDEAAHFEGPASGGGWRIALNAEVPIGNEAAEARVHRAILTRLQRLSTRSAREQAIKQEVLQALDNLEASWQRILAAWQNVFAEQQNYRAEQGQYRLGLRNSTEVLEAENRLAEAKVAEIAAHVDYQVAQVDLAFATGLLLGAAKVAW